MNSYDLFQLIMKAQVPEDYSEKLWKASRLAMRGAFQWDRDLPPVEDPQDILNFLNHHFCLVIQDRGTQDEPIQDALCALASVSCLNMNKALNHFNPTISSFVRGICFAFQSGRPPKLRKAALFFLPLIADKWFNTPARLMEPGETQSLCQDWASAVDVNSDVRGAVFAVFFSMINSEHWRPYIVPEKWRLLKHFVLEQDDCEPFRRCLDNPELIDKIPNVGSPSAKIVWLSILWLKSEELAPDVWKKLESVTKAVSRADLDVCLGAVDLELKKVERTLLQYNTWSKDAGAVALGETKGGLERARGLLLTFKRVQR